MGFEHDGDGNCLERRPEAATPGDDGPSPCDELPQEGDRPAMERPHPGDLHLGTQAQVDSFCENWDSVEGNLVLGAFEEPGAPPPPPPTVETLEPLVCLRWVHGYLHVSRHENLSDLHLPSLWGTRGSLSIVLNPGIERIDLPAFRWIGGDLSVQNNGALQAIDLPALGHVGQNVFVIGNRTLGEEAATVFAEGLCPGIVGGSVEQLDNG